MVTVLPQDVVYTRCQNSFLGRGRYVAPSVNLAQVLEGLFLQAYNPASVSSCVQEWQRSPPHMHEMIFFVHREDRAIQAARQCLRQAGYSIRSLSQPAFLTSVDQDRQCLVIIDSVRQSAYGVDVCERIRSSPFLGHLPIVLLTDAGEDSRLLGLEAGADDCVAEPYDAGELVARIQSLLDRFQSPLETNVNAVSTDIVIDRAAMRLSVRGEEVPTTTLEFRLLSYLALHRGRVFTRDLLLDAVWGDTQFVTPRTVDTCVRRVRHKIEPDRSRPTYLKTVRGVGYRFDGIARWTEHDA